MGSNTRMVFLVGLSVGFVLAGISAAALWRPVAPERVGDFPASSLGHSTAPGDRVTPRDIAALQAELDRLKGRRDVTERQPSHTARAGEDVDVGERVPRGSYARA